MGISGRCYCGHVTFTAPDPQVVAYCHCADCKRWTGAPAPAFAAVSNVETNVKIAETQFPSGVTRRNCPKCGSPLTARFPYLPDQTYIPVGVMDQVADHPPEFHCHSSAQTPWFVLDHDLPREDDSARDRLQTAKP